MSAYPPYKDGKPQVITLKEYDFAPWASTTCIDRRDGKYVVVIMEKPEEIVASVDVADSEVLDKIFRSAHKDYAQQLADK